MRLHLWGMAWFAVAHPMHLQLAACGVVCRGMTSHLMGLHLIACHVVCGAVCVPFPLASEHISSCMVFLVCCLCLC